MRIILPHKVDGDVLEWSSIPDDDYPEWAPGTYAQGAAVKVGEMAYEALTETDDSPEEGVKATPKTWLRLGAINRMRMFRAGTDSVSTAVGSLSVELRFSSLTNGLALFNAQGLTARVRVIDDLEGEVFDRTLELVDAGVDNYYDWHFAPYRTLPDHALTDLPPYYGARIVVDIVGATPDDTVSIGRLVCGRVLDLGLTQWGLEVSRLDSTIFERDGFGHLDIVPRRKVPVAKFMVEVPSHDTGRVQRELDQISEPVAVIGAPQYDLSLLYGIVRDARIIIPNLKFSDLAIEVEGF